MTLALVALLQLGAAATPLTLDDALALAARRNAELGVARADVEAAAAEARRAYRGVLPRLDVTGGIGRQFEGEQQQVNVVPNQAPPPAFVREAVTFPANDFGLYQLGVAMTWPLFDGFANWSLISSTRTRETAARRQLDESSLRIAFETTRRFHEVARQQRALEVRRGTAALSAELVKRADALFTAGRATRADTYAARVNQANDQIAVNAQLAVLARARADLAVVLGLTSDAGLEVVPPAELASAARAPDARHPPPLADLLARARRTRPAVAAAKLTGEAADLEVSRARGGYWPAVGLAASYQKQSPELTGTNGLFGSPSRQYVALAQVTLAWNLFAGLETSSGVRLASAQAARAQAQLEQAEQGTAAEVTAAREQVVTLADSVATVQALQEAADQTLRFTREQLEAGRASQLEVRDATLKLEQARLTWTSTVVDLAIARADLSRAIGGPP